VEPAQALELLDVIVVMMGSIRARRLAVGRFLLSPRDTSGYRAGRSRDHSRARRGAEQSATSSSHRCISLVLLVRCRDVRTLDFADSAPPNGLYGDTSAVTTPSA
jgi:hypothetical protein